MSDDPARLARNIRALVRWRLIFGLLMIGLPLATHALFERVARRLDALGDHGAPTIAVVTGASQGRGSPVFLVYAYKVDGTIYYWSVAQSDAPYRLGAKFPILYLPELPSFNQPSPDRAIAIADAASNRAFARNVELVMFLFFGTSTLGCHYSLRRLRMTGQTEANGVTPYRGRLISSANASSARSVSSAVVGGTFLYAMREGRAKVSARSARLMKWVAPIIVIVAALRIIGWFAIHP